MFQGHSVLVSVPCYNEQGKIGDVVRRVKEMDVQCVDEMLVIDDGSTDNSAEIARAGGATVIELGTCLGVGAAFRRTFQYVREHNFDICVCMAGNNKDEPNEIPRLLAPIVDEHYDLVQGSRHLAKGAAINTPFYRRVATKLHAWLFSIAVRKRVTESTNGFRAIRVSILDDPRINLNQQWLNEYELEPYLLFKVIRLGYRHTEVPCNKIYPAKELGQTKMRPVLDWWSILRPIFLLGLGLKR